MRMERGGWDEDSGRRSAQAGNTGTRDLLTV